MNESLGKLVVAYLTQHGQMAESDLAAKLNVPDGRALVTALDQLTSSGAVRRSPRGLLYVPGQLAAPPKPTRKPAAGAVVAFGTNTAVGRGITVEDRLITPGDILTSQDLVDVFRAGGIRGIRISKLTGTVLLISSVDNSLYRDRWHEGVFAYTGEGRHGDQQLTAGNRAIADSTSSGTPLLLFFKRATNRYEFQGEVRLLGEPRSEQQEDESGVMRRVYVFDLVPWDTQ